MMASSTPTLTDEAVALLISRMQAHPNLYDTSRLDYRDLAKREISWRDIAKHTGCTVSECKKRWKVIRDRFAREKKRRKLRGDPTFETWPMYDRLAFLLPYVKHRSRNKSSDGSPDATVNGISSDMVISDEESAQSAGSPSQETRPTGFTPPPAHERPKAPTSDALGYSLFGDTTSESTISTLTNLLNGISRCDETSSRDLMAALANTFSAIQSSVTDEEELFGRYVSASLKRLPFRSRSLAKLRIQQVLHQVQTCEAIASIDSDYKDTNLLNSHIINPSHFINPATVLTAAAQAFAKSD